MPHGLRNSDNICYANAVFQCLASCHGLVSERTESGSFTSTFLGFLKDVRDGDGKTLDATDVVKWVSKQHPHSIQFGEFNDACEFLLLLIDDLEVPRDMFFGKSVSCLKCDACNHIVRSKSEQSVLTLTYEPSKTMEEMVSEIFEKVFLEDFRCEKCQETGVVQNTTMTRLPRILIMTFANKLRANHNQVVPMTATFRLSNHVENTYRLRGFVARRSSHFAALVVDQTDKMYICDDESVIGVKDKTAFEAFAHTMVYELQTVA